MYIILLYENCLARVYHSDETFYCLETWRPIVIRGLTIVARCVANDLQ